MINTLENIRHIGRELAAKENERKEKRKQKFSSAYGKVDMFVSDLELSEALMFLLNIQSYNYFLMGFDLDELALITALIAKHTKAESLTPINVINSYRGLVKTDKEYSWFYQRIKLICGAFEYFQFNTILTKVRNESRCPANDGMIDLEKRLIYFLSGKEMATQKEMILSVIDASDDRVYWEIIRQVILNMTGKLWTMEREKPNKNLYSLTTLGKLLNQQNLITLCSC